MQVGVQKNPYNSYASSGPRSSSIPKSQTSGGVPIQAGWNAGTGGVPQGTKINVGAPARTTTQNTTTQQQYSAPAPDPYAQWGGQAKYQALVDGFNSQKSNIYGSATDSANGINAEFGNSIDAFLSSNRTAQAVIDKNAAKNYLAKQQGVAGIMGSVGRGIRSSGVMLANKNAGNSSAAGAIAAAIGNQGQRQMADVGNQFALGQDDIKTAQTNFAEQQRLGANQIRTTKQSKINELVLSARDKFAQLDAAMANASLPGRIAIDQEREKVRQQVVGQLQGLDTQLNTGIASIQAQSEDQRMEEASRLGKEGRDLGADAFQYSTEIPLEQQNTGPFASELPLFSLNRGKRTIA